MPEIIVEQAILEEIEGRAYQVRARSPQFAESWISGCEKLCRAFGRPPEGIPCPPAMFAQPLGRGHVAVVQVAPAMNGHPGRLRFHFCVLKADEYEGLSGDPFAVAERSPPAWDANGSLDALTWPRVPFPKRTVQDVQSVLIRPDGPNLLGGSQVLLDGGRITFERPAPDPKVLRDLWTLMPTRSRAEMWPATFAFSNELRFHTVVIPPGLRNSAPQEFPHYVTEEEAGDYPGELSPSLLTKPSYEYRLQRAAEHGDQEELDNLFARRSRTDMWKLGLLILVGMLLLPVLIRLLAPSSPPHDTDPPTSSSTVDR
jgi:hypothetical protein